MRHYEAYGILLASEMDLPGFQGVPPGNADALVERGRIDLPPGFGGSVAIQAARQTGEDTVLLSWKDVGAFRVRPGGVHVDPAAGVPSAILGHFLTGPVMAALLYLRGSLVLHASGISYGGGAALLLGGPCRGKSTLAALLERRGHPLVTDDVAATTAGASEISVQWGPPQLKLTDEAARQLGPPVRDRPGERTAAGKRTCLVSRRQGGKPLPLRSIYVLSPRRGNVAIETLPQALAVTELIRHSYCARILSGQGAAENLKQCARVTRSVRIRRLGYPPWTVLATAEEVTALVEDDLRLDLPAAPAPL